MCISRKDFVKHLICKESPQEKPYHPPEGEVESLSTYKKDYTCKCVDLSTCFSLRNSFRAVVLVYMECDCRLFIWPSWNKKPSCR